MNKVIDYMIREGFIEFAERDIYLYGVECLLLKLMHFTSYFLIAIWLKGIKELVILWFVFGSLRRNAGGYHAKTKIGCYFFSCSVIIIFLLISKFYIVNVLQIILLLISSICIWTWSPICNENMKLNNNEKIYFSRKTKKSIIIIIIFYFICATFKMEHVTSVITESYVLMMICLILGKAKNKSENEIFSPTI